MNQRMKITNQGVDKLSSLPDDQLHKILSFLGTRQAVQTSIPSKRWRHVWTTTPFLTFDCLSVSAKFLDKVILDVHELENASIKVWDANQFHNATLRQKMLAYRPFIITLSKLSMAKILTLDSAMIEGLSAVLDYLTRVPSPFKNLKYVKLPQGCEESSISTALRKYLLGGNPGATFVTALPQEYCIESVLFVHKLMHSVS
ncbi:hypothetical protein POM88_002544 [Heracleum sosnowskyi]|uniref:F-box domain-containing protein n=1 Tax=Heracleum sosnowskyi TaxID=360622 RepID=A0AAD8JEX0_9APIA|nr:hypothetical protein POM88_002544 [Heracleum sosnowskyi]